MGTSRMRINPTKIADNTNTITFTKRATYNPHMTMEYDYRHHTYPDRMDTTSKTNEHRNIKLQPIPYINHARPSKGARRTNRSLLRESVLPITGWNSVPNTKSQNCWAVGLRFEPWVFDTLVQIGNRPLSTF